MHMYSYRPALCTPGWCTDLPSCTKVHLYRVVHLHSAYMSSWSQYAQVCKGRFLRRSNLAIARTPTVIVILRIRGNGKSWKLCALFSDWVGGPAFIGPAIIYYGLGRPGEISLSIANLAWCMVRCSYHLANIEIYKSAICYQVVIHRGDNWQTWKFVKVMLKSLKVNYKMNISGLVSFTVQSFCGLRNN